MKSEYIKEMQELATLKAENEQLKKLNDNAQDVALDLHRENERLKDLLKEIEDICTDYDTPGIEALKIMELIKHSPE